LIVARATFLSVRTYLALAPSQVLQKLADFMQMSRRRWPRFGELLVGCAVLTLLDIVGSIWLWEQQAARFERPRWPSVGAPLAAVIFYTSIPEDARRRLDHAVALRGRGAVKVILIVGGYRSDSGYNGAAELAARARLYISEAGAVAHDVGSYDTLSNLEAICDLRAAAAPGSGLILVSDPLHMVRIWTQRWRIDCADDLLIGYDTVTAEGGPVWKWYLAHKHWLAEAGRLLFGEQFYRAALQQWRRRQKS
jgi:hypothetical protein